MSTDLALIMLAAAGMGVAVLLTIQGLRIQPAQRSASAASWHRQLALLPDRCKTVGLPLLAALVILALTRSFVLAAALALAVLFRDRLGTGTRSAQDATQRLEALAGWVEALRDAVSAGSGLEEAFVHASATDAPGLEQPLIALRVAIRSRQPLPDALRVMASATADGDADRIIAALMVSAQARGTGLTAVLRDLATETRELVAARRRIEAARRATRRSVTLLLGVFGLVAANLLLFNPSYLTPYTHSSGQMVLLVVVALIGSGLLLLRRVAALHVPPRLLAEPSEAT